MDRVAVRHASRRSGRASTRARATLASVGSRRPSVPPGSSSIGSVSEPPARDVEAAHEPSALLRPGVLDELSEAPRPRRLPRPPGVDGDGHHAAAELARLAEELVESGTAA